MVEIRALSPKRAFSRAPDELRLDLEALELGSMLWDSNFLPPLPGISGEGTKTKGKIGGYPSYKRVAIFLAIENLSRVAKTAFSRHPAL